MPDDPVTSDHWDHFIMRLGGLTHAMGLLEMTLIAMHCRMTGKSEDELGLEHAFQHRRALGKRVKSLHRTTTEKADFIKRLEEVRHWQSGGMYSFTLPPASSATTRSVASRPGA